ncbi:MAG: energy transducer TonB [Paludibacteraceae bacterium]|nr:energy transducer TonB [Paludibacteraceae bacterium]
MEVKKSTQANLESSKLLYGLVGLVASLSLCFIALEWTQVEVKKYDREIQIYEDEMDDVLQTQQDEQQPEEIVQEEQVIEEVLSDVMEVVDNSTETEAIQMVDQEDNSGVDVGKVIEKPIETKKEEDDDDQVIFVVVETMPEYPGGQAALMKYLSENVRYPAICQEQGIQGRVVCQFTVNKDGSIVDVDVARSSGDANLDKEAKRVISTMPKWKPGKQRGKAVRVKYTVPVTFRIQ